MNNVNDARGLTETQQMDFHAQGFVQPNECLPDQTLQACLAELSALAQDQGVTNRSELINPHLRYPAAYDAIMTSTLLDQVESLLGSDLVCWGSSYLCKWPTESIQVRWHQDAEYWPFPDHSTISVWIALDDADAENGALAVFPDSHLLGRLTTIERAPSQKNYSFDRHEVILPPGLTKPDCLPCASGQWILFSDRLVHGSGSNVSTNRRCALVLRYMSSAVIPADEWNQAAVCCRGMNISRVWKHHQRPQTAHAIKYQALGAIGGRQSSIPDTLTKQRRRLIERIEYAAHGILHLGAHTGEERDHYARLGKPVMWVEADPSTFKRLQQNLNNLPQQRALCGLLAEIDDRETTFLRSNNRQGVSSSIFDFGPYANGEQSLWPELGLHMIDQLKLPSVRLDSLLQKSSVDPKDYDFWVLDLQGAESLALQGAQRSLNSCKALLVEISCVEIYQGGVLWPALRKQLISHGFVPLWEPYLAHDEVLFVRRDATQAPLSVFHSSNYQRHNQRRLEHLQSLGLDLHKKTTLEVGAGIGDHSAFYLQRQCRVLATDARPENIDVLAKRYQGVDTFESRLLDLNAPQPLNRHFEIVHCYGLLYHLEKPSLALRFLAEHCTGMLLLESVVSPGNEAHIEYVAEPADAPTQAYGGTGCRPTRRWIWEQLKRWFPYVYAPRTQPCHEEFPLEWRDLVRFDADGLVRAVFIASRTPLDLSSLLATLPERYRPLPNCEDQVSEQIKAAHARHAPQQYQESKVNTLNKSSINKSLQITIVTTCMGRLSFLQQTLASMIAQQRTRVIVVDYSCPESTGDWVEQHHPQVTVIRAKDRTSYNAAQARNLGARAAETPWLFFVDADILLQPDFLSKLLPHLEADSSYHASPWRPGSMGTFICSQKAFTELDGYDECMQGWGDEDRDFIVRLGLSGYRKRSFSIKALSIIEHDDEVRTHNQAVKDRHISHSINRLYITIKHDLMRLYNDVLTLQRRQNLYQIVNNKVTEAMQTNSPVELVIPVIQRRHPTDWSSQCDLRYRVLPPSSR